MVELKTILEELNTEYFDDKVKVNDITIMKRRNKRIFGRYNRQTRIIEVNRIVIEDYDVLRFIIFHELCHAKMLFRKKRHKHHTKKFYQLMMMYKDYETNLKKYYLFVKDYWLRIGCLTKEEL